MELREGYAIGRAYRGKTKNHIWDDISPEWTLCGLHRPRKYPYSDSFHVCYECKDTYDELLKLARWENESKPYPGASPDQACEGIVP